VYHIYPASGGNRIGSGSSPTATVRSSVVAPSVLHDIRRLALTDGSYQALIARHQHYDLRVQDGLVYSTSGLLYVPRTASYGQSSCVRCVTLRPAVV
jgi:hypothetical protein